MNPLAYIFAGFGGYLVYEGLQHRGVVVDPRAPAVQAQSTSKFAPLNGLTRANLTAVAGAPKLAASVTPSGGSLPKMVSFAGIARNGAFSRNSRATAGAEQQLIDKTTKDLKAKFDKLSGQAKAEGAAKLNSLIKPNPGITANDDWASASKKVGASLGTLAGAGVCGPPCAALGAMAGAYLGEKLGDEIKKHWKDVESWAGNAAKTVGKKVSNTAKKLLPFI